MEVGFIVALKTLYRRGQIEKAIDQIDRVMTEDLYYIELQTAIAEVYNIWNRIDGPLTCNCWLTTRLLRDRMNSEQATLHNVGEIDLIVFNSTLEDEDNCFDQPV